MKSLCRLEIKVLTAVTENSLIKKNQTVLLAFSGGADSTALLIILKKLSELLDFSIYALHINHMLRGNEAKEDEKKCVQLCKDLGIKCYTKKVIVKQFAKQYDLSIEQAGRELRYKELFALKNTLNADCIATAHHYDDNIETIIMRIIRGTGLDGLCGIELKRHDGIIRPLLSVKKEEILNYLHENKISYCTDKTNFENFYFRNRIRNCILPEFININADFKDIVYRISKQAKMLKELISIELNDYKNFITVKGKYAEIDIDLLFEAKDYIKPYIIRQMLSDIGCLINIEKKNIDSILSMSESNTVWSIDMPAGVKAIRNYKYLAVTKSSDKKPECREFNYPLAIDKENILHQLGINILIKHVDQFEKKLSSSFKIYIDYDKIKGNVFIRNRQTGDAINPLNMQGNISLKKYFINKKIPKHKRDKIPLLCDADNIIWIIGYTLNNKYKVDKNTKKIIMITVKNMEQDDA